MTFSIDVRDMRGTLTCYDLIGPVLWSKLLLQVLEPAHRDVW